MLWVNFHKATLIACSTWNWTLCRMTVRCNHLLCFSNIFLSFLSYSKLSTLTFCCIGSIPWWILWPTCRASTYASSLISAGDLNIHFCVTSNFVTLKSLDVLDQYSLVQHVIGATHAFLMFSLDAVNCVCSPSTFLQQCCLVTRVSSADSTCWSPTITQPFAVSADVASLC